MLLTAQIFRYPLWSCHKNQSKSDRARYELKEIKEPRIFFNPFPFLFYNKKKGKRKADTCNIIHLRPMIMMSRLLKISCLQSNGLFFYYQLFQMTRMVKFGPVSIVWRAMAHGHRLWCVELWGGFD
jgi:hypothetical protein